MDELTTAISEWLDSKMYADVEKYDGTVWATPVWSADSEDQRLRALLAKHAINEDTKSVTVIPAAARAIKQLDCELVVTRNTRGVLSVVLTTRYGNIIVYWDVNEVHQFAKIHDSVWLEVIPHGSASNGITATLGGYLRRVAAWVESL